jgi:hypothetical protein
MNEEIYYQEKNKEIEKHNNIIYTPVLVHNDKVKSINKLDAYQLIINDKGNNLCAYIKNITIKIALAFQNFEHLKGEEFVIRTEDIKRLSRCTVYEVQYHNENMVQYFVVNYPHENIMHMGSSENLKINIPHTLVWGTSFVNFIKFNTNIV